MTIQVFCPILNQIFFFFFGLSWIFLTQAGVEPESPPFEPPGKPRSVSCLVVSNSLWSHGLEPTRLLCPWNSPGLNTEMGRHALPQGNFLTQGQNPDLVHCRRVLYGVSHQGSPLSINPWSDIWLANIFSHLVGWHFTLSMVFFALQKL